MIVKAFKSKSPFNVLLLFAIIIVLRIPYLLLDIPIPVYTYNEPFSVFLFHNFQFIWTDKLWNVIITSVVIFAQALWLNKIVMDFSLLFRGSYLPALFYVIMASMFPTFLTLDAAILITFSLLWLLTKLFGLYKSNHATMITFDSGMIIACTSLLYFPSVLWLLLIWIALIIFRPFAWREWISGLAGFMLPYLFVALFYFWNDDMQAFIRIWSPLKNSLWITNIHMSLIDFLPLLPITLIFLIALNKMKENFYKNVVHVRKCQQLLIFTILVSALAYYIKPSFRFNHFILLAAPLAVFISYYFLVAKKAWLSELLVLFLMLSILFFQVY